MNYDNPMRQQTFSLPDLIRQQYNDLEPKVRSILSTPEIFGIQRIVLTGCGDSYAAGMATKHAFEMLTNIPTEVVTAIELSRFYHKKQLGFAPNNPLVIAVSNSGGVARVGEAIEKVTKSGAFTLGLTGNPDSLLAKKASRILKLDIPKFQSAPGVRSYLVSVLTLLLMAIRIGEVRGVNTMDWSSALRKDIITQADMLEKMLPEMDKQVFAVAESWKAFNAFDFVGAGFDYASAWYGHAKIFEAVGKFAMHVNMEEWLHLNFFIRDADNVGTVILANTTNPALSRIKEVISYASKLKRPMAVITDGSRADFGVDANYINVPKTYHPLTMPLTHFAPMALLAGYLCELNGEEYGRGEKDRWEFSKGAKCVTDSEIII